MNIFNIRDGDSIDTIILNKVTLISYKKNFGKTDNKYYDLLEIYLEDDTPILYYSNDVPNLKDIHNKLLTILREL